MLLALMTLQCAGIWRVNPTNLAAYNAASLDERKRSVLDYSATNFLNATWNETYFMSPNIQDVPYNPLNPDAHFPIDFYDGNWVVRGTLNNSINYWYHNHTGNMMEGSVMLEVRAYCNAPTRITLLWLQQHFMC
jgi:hypothetical protein